MRNIFIFEMTSTHNTQRPERPCPNEFSTTARYIITGAVLVLWKIPASWLPLPVWGWRREQSVCQGNSTCCMGGWGKIRMGEQSVFLKENPVSWAHHHRHRRVCAGSSNCSGGSCAERRNRSGRSACHIYDTGTVSRRCADVCAPSGGACAWTTSCRGHTRMDGLLKTRYRQLVSVVRAWRNILKYRVDFRAHIRDLSDTFHVFQVNFFLLLPFLTCKGIIVSIYNSDYT